MLFSVERTSVHYDEQPCEESKRIKLVEDDVWCIEISSLSQLVDMLNKYGELIIKQSDVDPKTPCGSQYNGFKNR